MAGSTAWTLTAGLLALAGLGCGAKANTPVVRTEAEAETARLACKFDKGAKATDTLATTWPTGTQIPIDHIVMIMQENRSFDHYFSGLSHDGVDVASPTATNPGPDGTPVPRYHAQEYCISSDVNHEWAGAVIQYNGGKMDGFAKTNVTDKDPNGHRALGYMDETDLPFYYDLARTFSISDRHFCSAPGNTAPNREYFAAASSRGAVDESNISLPQEDAAGNHLQNIYSLIDGAGISWKFYAPEFTPQTGSFAATNFDFATSVFDKGAFPTIDDFYADAAAGTLPSISFIDEATSDKKSCLSNEHPTKSPQLGQKFIANVVNAVMHSPNWKTTALFVTWDEHGGFYDHVYPPPACPPDDYPPAAFADGKLVPQPGAFDRYGVRVPLLVVSPYVKRGHVSHRVTDHTSLLRFIEARFNLPALTRRDANAEPPFDMFDFAHPDFSVPTLKAAVIDDQTKHSCGAPDPSCTF